MSAVPGVEWVVPNMSFSSYFIPLPMWGPLISIEL